MKRLIPLLGRAVLALGVALGLGWGVVVVAIVRAGGVDRAARADAIVVLGAAQYDGRPSPVLKGRLDHALALWTHCCSHSGCSPAPPAVTHSPTCACSTPITLVPASSFASC